MPNTNWTTDNIPNLENEVFIVTGANAGLGFEASKELARKGASVILACRNMDKANIALARLKEEIPNASLEVLQLDLASLKSIHHFANEFKAKYDRLDVLLNNAGIMFGSYKKTEDGFESTFGVDHLGHFALTGLLLDVLQQTPKSRVINVTSFAHTSGEMDFDDLMFEKGYEPGEAYPRAKLANILFTHELQRRFESAGTDCLAVSTNPGFVRTGWIRHMRERNKLQAFLVGIGLRILGQEDVDSSIDFVHTLDIVDKDNVFNMGICVGSAISTYETASDPRIKAQLMVSPVFLTPEENIMPIPMDVAYVASGAAKTYHAVTGSDLPLGPLVQETNRGEDEPEINLGAGMDKYYLPGKPGYAPTWENHFSLISMVPVMKWKDFFEAAAKFDTTPIYMVYGTKAFSRHGAAKFYEMSGGPKNRLILEGAGHFDIYWKPEFVEPAVEGLAEFLETQVEPELGESNAK